MTQEIPSFNHIQTLQRPMHRLPVPSLSMSLRSRRAEHPTLTLALPQLDRCHDRAEKLLTKTIASYNKKEHHVVDPGRWKRLRSRHGIQLFRGRHSTETANIPLLCVGALRGSFDDIMEGVYCQNTEEMLLMNAITCPRLTESTVLYKLQRQTQCDPYAFTGIKWATIKVAVASNRNLCYFDKMGLVRQTPGKQMAYHIMQSVDLPEYPHKAMHKRVQASLCYIFEEMEDNLVKVYMQGVIDDVALSCFSTMAISDMLLAVTNALECTRAKKLAEMMAMVPARRYRRKSSRRCCDVCRGNTSFFETLEECAGCDFKYVCKKCRLKENVLARDKTSDSHLMRAEFCRVCTSTVNLTSINMLRAKARDLSVAGSRTADQNITFCNAEKAEPEDVDIPGSDRSLTAFTFKISTQMQDLNSRNDSCETNLLREKVFISDDDAEDALLGEDRDVLNSFGKKSYQFMPLDKDLAYNMRCSSRSTTSTVSSSYYHDDDDTEQYRTSLFARLVQVTNQAEATLHLTKKQSLIAHSVFQRNRRCTQW